MVAISIKAKGLDPLVKYNFSPMEERVDFLAAQFREEVMRETGGKQLKKIKKLKKLLKASMSVLAAGISMAPKAFAATGMAAPAAETITPALVMKWGLTLATISVSAGVAIGFIMLTIAGIYRMFRKRQEADAWSQDIIKGLIQVLIAVPTVYVLYFLAQLLFSHLTVLKALF
jgi:hypothetical protein